MADDCGLVGFVGAEEPEPSYTDAERFRGMQKFVRESHDWTMEAWLLVSKVWSELTALERKGAPGTNSSAFRKALKASSEACSVLDRVTDITYPIVNYRHDAAWDDWLTEEGYLTTKPTSPQTEGPLQ